jgi:hypothetical protein
MGAHSIPGLWVLHMRIALAILLRGVIVIAVGALPGP